MDLEIVHHLRRNASRYRWLLLLIVVGAGVVFQRLPRHISYNVLLITLDTTRADHIGCYGHREALTPTLDALAKNGVLFEQAYVTVPLTLPSHASLLTGLYPPENGMHLNGRGQLSTQIPTLASTLQKQGYETAAFIGAVVLNSKAGLDQGFQLYDDDMAGGVHHGHESHLMRHAGLVVDSALRWLRGRQAQPFFAWVHLYDPHAPFEGHAEVFQDRFQNEPYDGDIAFADLHVGRLIQHLKDRGELARTLVIVVGDHGEGFGEHAELEHGFMLYNSTLQVPLIMSNPGLCRTGYRVPTPVSLVDIFPTVLDCLQVPVPRRVSGVNLNRALKGETIEPRVCFSETESCFAAYGWAPLASVTTDAWKYVKTAREELYELQRDPGELKNLAGSQPDQLQKMRQLFQTTRDQMADSAERDVHYTPAELQKLRSLGYLSGKGAPPADPGKPLPDVKDMIGFYNTEIQARKLLQDGKTDEALADLRRVTRDAPEFTPAWLTLGAALQSLNRHTEAIEVYRAALKAKPEAADPHFDLAKLYANRGDRAQAIEEYMAALKSDPNYAMAHINLAVLLSEQGPVQQARQHFERGLEEAPDSTVGHFNFGLFLLRQRESELAVTHLDRALQLDPLLPQIHFQLGLANVALQRYHEALSHFEATLQLSPQYPQAAAQLERAREKLLFGK
ncbi:MAG: tetratricopeptide repeat protein [Planctomycetaceae bacterium]|nr:tetratricopeptide repeat protein [Planctomycetaceae bacterium]